MHPPSLTSVQVQENDFSSVFYMKIHIKNIYKKIWENILLLPYINYNNFSLNEKQNSCAFENKTILNTSLDNIQITLEHF